MPRTSLAMFTPHGDPQGRIGDPDIGGQCVYVRQLALHLGQIGFGVSIFTRDRGDGRPSQEAVSDSVVVRRIPCGPAGFIPKELLLPHLPEFAERAAPWVETADILHSHYWDGGFVAQRLRRDQPWFHTTHSIGRVKQAALPDDKRYQYSDRIRIETDVFNRCDCVLALTETERDQISSLYGTPASHIAVIPPGVDVDRFTPAQDKEAIRSRLGLPEALTIFALGRLDERKGFDLLFRAFALADARFLQRRTSLVFSAGGGNASEAREEAALRGLAQELGIIPSLTWLPVLEESSLPDYYRAADLFALPSRYEPFGIVTLEAMASALPVIATREGGPTRVIRDGVNGLLVDPTNTREFAGALVELLRSPRRRRAMGNAARQTVEGAYSWTSIARRHAELFGQHLGRLE